MSGECCVNPGDKQSHEAQGHIEEIGGVNTYKTGQGKSGIILFTDVFGNTFPNAQKIADTIAKDCQATVFIPDCFNGDPMDREAPNLMALLPDWLKKHPPTDAFAVGEKLLSIIKGQYQSIGLMGFCYGAKPVINIIAHPELSSTVKSAVVAHPSFLVPEEASQVKRPILFLCAENDFAFTSEIRQEFEKVLKLNGLGTFIEYPGTTHGFVCRPRGPEPVLEQARKALQDAIQYFKNNL